MAPRQPPKPAKTPSLNKSSSDIELSQKACGDSSQPQSQAPGINPDQFAMMINKQKEQTAARQTARMKEIAHDRKSQLAEIQAKKEECERKHHENLHNLRKPKLQHLKTLLQQKLNLEAQISASQTFLSDGAKTTIHQVQLVLKDRGSALQ